MVRIEIVFLACLCGLLIGYIWGRRIGTGEGFNQGLVTAPMQIREESLLEGKCIICNEVLINAHHWLPAGKRTQSLATKSRAGELTKSCKTP